MKRTLLTLLLLSLLLLSLACRSEPLPQETAEATVAPIAPTEASQTAPAPTPAPTATATPAPTPVPTSTPEPTPELITDAMLESGMFDHYYDDAVFVGDSLTWIFSHYVRNVRNAGQPEYLGGAKFLAIYNMNIKRASQNDVRKNDTNLEYRGRPVSLTDGLHLLGAKKVFLMLGLNDLHLRRWSEVEENFVTTIETLKALCPDAEIIIEGVLPVRSTYYSKKSPAWNDFNLHLWRICEEEGVTFFNFSEEFMDANGELNGDYCNDGRCHLNITGEEVWVRCLRQYAARKTRGNIIFETPFSADRWLSMHRPQKPTAPPRILQPHLPV